MRSTVQEIEIGLFSVELATGTLLRDGVELDLRPQAFRAFKTLIQNKGQYVDYERMIAEAWAQHFVCWTSIRRWILSGETRVSNACARGSLGTNKNIKPRITPMTRTRHSRHWRNSRLIMLW